MLLAGIALAGAIYIFAPSDRSISESAQGDTRSGPDIAPRRSASNPLNNSPQEASVGQKQSLALDIANPYFREAITTNDRKSTFDRLSVNPDPAAALTADMLATSCNLYADHAYDATIRRIDQMNGSDVQKTIRKSVAAGERAKCVGFDAARVHRALELRQYVAKLGDARGVLFAATGANPPPMTQLVEEARQAAELKDPLALMEVGSFFVARQDLPRGALIDVGNGVSVSPSIIRDAFFLATCSYGANCGPENMMVTSRCVTAGWCDSGNLEETLTRYSYTPADADQLSMARQVVLHGILTGQWPRNFWSAAAPTTRK